MSMRPTRRGFLHTASVAALLGGANRARAQPVEQRYPRSQIGQRPTPATKKLAVVTTAYHYLSHAYHICGRFLEGYLRNGQPHYPDFAIAGMYVQQQKDNDLSHEMAQKHGFTLYPNVAGALRLGTDKLAVDGVLLIGEHGDYPYNAKGQKLYPRYDLFQKVVAVFRESKRSVPVFCDKHLSYSWKHGVEMVKTARELGFPLMAGSSLPVTWRRPELELPLGAKIEDALVASRGELEIYGIHALEALQSMVERRLQGQQGVQAVTCLQGDAVWKAGDDLRWSWQLLEHALGRSDSLNVGNIRDNCRHYNILPGRPLLNQGPVAFLIEYRDGLKAAALFLNGHVDDTTLAARIGGQREPVSTLFYLPPPPGAGFLQALTERIEDFLATGKPHCPVERTLLTGGMLDFLLESRVQGGRRMETPELDVRYTPAEDSGFLRGSSTHPVRE
jgi:hypothetical protein